MMTWPDKVYQRSEISAGPPGEAAATCRDRGPTSSGGNGTTEGEGDAQWVHNGVHAIDRNADALFKLKKCSSIVNVHCK